MKRASADFPLWLVPAPFPTPIQRLGSKWTLAMSPCIRVLSWVEAPCWHRLFSDASFHCVSFDSLPGCFASAVQTCNCEGVFIGSWSPPAWMASVGTVQLRQRLPADEEPHGLLDPEPHAVQRTHLCPNCKITASGGPAGGSPDLRPERCWGQ